MKFNAQSYNTMKSAEDSTPGAQAQWAKWARGPGHNGPGTDLGTVFQNKCLTNMLHTHIYIYIYYTHMNINLNTYKIKESIEHLTPGTKSKT